ncbi:hypothetical protein C7M52_02619 [Mixta theicola]|nr:hypothetical protein [Mixta theicola]QHM76636.1 hypothetical protein C7M52_02619 [Mixta theicola]
MYVINDKQQLVSGGVLDVNYLGVDDGFYRDINVSGTFEPPFQAAPPIYIFPQPTIWEQIWQGIAKLFG